MFIDGSKWASMLKKRHKYGVAPKEQRTYNDVVYDSKAEATRAAELDLLLRADEIIGWERQKKIQLGLDVATTVDFIVTSSKTRWVEEVKGKETPEFRRVRKLWMKYGPMNMWIMKRVGNSWKTEILSGGAAKTEEQK